MRHRMVDTVEYGAAYVQLLLTHITSKKGRRIPRMDEDTQRVVLVIPGFLGPRAVSFPLEKRFDLEGVPAFSFNVGLTSALPRHMVVKLLKRRVDKVRTRNPKLKRLDIVAHSMGGLIAHDAIMSGVFAGFEDVRLVTLGTPFMGTWAALMAVLLPGAIEMLPVHPRIWMRNGSGPNVPFLSISGEHDLLAPPERCKHPQAEHLVLPVDHAGLVLRKDVFKEAYAFLARP